MEKLKHIAVVVIALFLFLMLPAMQCVDIGALFTRNTDSGSHTSGDIPGIPEGEFLVIINKDKHWEDIGEWEKFFRGEDSGVITEDIGCLASASDPAGIQLAEIYQARLGENQMTIRTENPVLTVSMGETGMFDVIVMSQKTAAIFGYDEFGENSLVIEVKGE